MRGAWQASWALPLDCGDTGPQKINYQVGQMKVRARTTELKKATVLDQISFRGEVSEIPDGTAVMWETSALWGATVTPGKPVAQASALWGCDINDSDKF